jgi:hypothetical protein
VWDSGNPGLATIIASQNLELSKILYGLTRGTDYQFKVRAQNVYGYGEFSDVVTIRASSVPDTMIMVDSVSHMQTIVISWQVPTSDGGESVTGYDVQLLTLENQFVNDEECTGEIANGLTCLFGH